MAKSGGVSEVSSVFAVRFSDHELHVGSTMFWRTAGSVGNN